MPACSGGAYHVSVYSPLTPNVLEQMILQLIYQTLALTSLISVCFKHEKLTV